MSMVLFRAFKQGCRFFFVQYTKMWKIYVDIAIIKCLCISNGRKICRYICQQFHSKAKHIYPNFDFWYENIPSGNPAFKLNSIKARQ
jgi:hypothetical protein